MLIPTLCVSTPIDPRFALALAIKENKRDETTSVLRRYQAVCCNDSAEEQLRTEAVKAIFRKLELSEDLPLLIGTPHKFFDNRSPLEYAITLNSHSALDELLTFLGANKTRLTRMLELAKQAIELRYIASLEVLLAHNLQEITNNLPILFGHAAEQNQEDAARCIVQKATTLYRDFPDTLSRFKTLAKAALPASVHFTFSLGNNNKELRKWTHILDGTTPVLGMYSSMPSLPTASQPIDIPRNNSRGTLAQSMPLLSDNGSARVQTQFHNSLPSLSAALDDADATLAAHSAAESPQQEDESPRHLSLDQHS